MKSSLICSLADNYLFMFIFYFFACDHLVTASHTPARGCRSSAPYKVREQSCGLVELSF